MYDTLHRIRTSRKITCMFYIFKQHGKCKDISSISQQQSFRNFPSVLYAFIMNFIKV